MSASATNDIDQAIRS